MPDLDALRALVERATPGDGPETPGEAYERTTAWYEMAAQMADLAPELLAVVETGEALQRLLPHICGNSPHYGAAHNAAKAHREALRALDAKLDEVTR